MRHWAVWVGVVVGLTSLGARPSRARVPALDHVFVVVLENQSRDDILGHPSAPRLTQLAHTFTRLTNYHGVWHSSLPNYVAMLTGDFVGVDVTTGYTVGIGTNDSPANATDALFAETTTHRWRVNGPSLASQLVASGRDWRGYFQGLPTPGSTAANWPGDLVTGSLYAAKHNPFAYLASVQDNPSERRNLVPLEQLFGDLGAGTVPAFSMIVPDQCRDMHGLDAPLAPCTYGDDAIASGDAMVGWLYQAITGSAMWKHGTNALVITFDEGSGESFPCAYASTTERPPAACYAAENFTDPVLTIVITSYGTARGVEDATRYSHYALLRTLEEGFRLPALGHAGDATSTLLRAMVKDE